MLHASRGQTKPAELFEGIERLLTTDRGVLQVQQAIQAQNLLPRPIIELSFESGSFAFNEEDIERVFEAIGDCLSFSLLDGRRKVIAVMSTFDSCIKTFRMVNDKKVQHLSKTDSMKVNFLADDRRSIDLLKQVNSDSNKRESEQLSCPDGFETSSMNEDSSRNGSQSQPGTPGSQPKITCKFEIDAFDEEASKNFLLAKRIIGPKGSNMKKIIEACFEDRPFEADALKLRLRGQGSGFKEGPGNRECNEPLHLCISAKNQLFYDRATSLIERLLVDVCKNFETFAVKQNLVELLYDNHTGEKRPACRIFKKESVNGHRPLQIIPPLKAESVNKDKKKRKGGKENKDQPFKQPPGLTRHSSLTHDY